MNSEIDAVTGSFSYTGQYITRRLLGTDRKVRTLTGHHQPSHPLAANVESFPYNFNRPERLAESLRGIDTLYNTYWVRFPHGKLNYDVAIRNLRILIDGAVKAGVRKIVHTSIINPSENSPYAYFRGKAEVERAIRECGLAYTILRPTVIFGNEDILVNNIAWMLRTFSVFLIPGSGDYRIQPIFVEDLAEAAVREGQSSKSEILDATGPETFTYRTLVEGIAAAVGRRPRLINAPAPVVYGLGTALGWFRHDVILTYEEIVALMNGILYSERPPLGAKRLSEWLVANKDRLGRSYRSEIKRHFELKEPA